MKKAKSHRTIGATLTFLSQALTDAVLERIESGGQFTTVTDARPDEIAPVCVALFSLEEGGEEAGFFNITHIGLVKKGQRVATNQVRIRVTDIFTLPNVPSEEIVSLMPSKLQPNGKLSFLMGYSPVPQKTGEAILEALLKKCPEFSNKIEALLRKTTEIKFPRNTRSEDAAVEKDALGLSLDIFGIDRSEVLRSWYPIENNLGNSFLSGLDNYKAYEDDLINHDLNTVPGWEIVSKSITGIVEFSNDSGEKLAVINANRKPLERATGVDLIYFHRQYEAFTFVQYKMMDRQAGEDDRDYYYNPKEKSHDVELERMMGLQLRLDQESWSGTLPDYRLSKCPIFFKVCKKIQLKANDASIVPGAYIPLDQWNILLSDPSTEGKKGGRKISYGTLNNRYVGTQTFIDLVKKGFVGTQSLNSKKVAAFIEAAIKEGHSVMYAIDDKKIPERRLRGIRLRT